MNQWITPPPKVSIMRKEINFILLTVLSAAIASCPDVNTAVNCSFEATKSCLDSYSIYDQHGLKWFSKTGAISVTKSTCHNPYAGCNYPWQAVVTTLQASPKGQYMYLPGTTDQRAHGLWTDLLSPPVTVDHSGCLHLIYHNNICGEKFDPTVVNFKVAMRSENSEDILLREYPCTNDSSWYSTKIPVHGISGIYRIAFSGRQHPTENQTIGVDHVIYTDQSCSIKDHPSYEHGDCNFEFADFCGYHRREHESPLRWLPIQKKMRTGSYDYGSAPAGYFLTIWGKQSNVQAEYSAEHVTSPKISVQAAGCLTVTYYSGRYYKDNDNLTALQVSKVAHHLNNSRDVLYSFPATLGKEWMKAYVDLPEGSYHVRFTAKLKPPFGESPYDVIALDDIEVHQRPCGQVKCDAAICEAKNVQFCNGRGKCIGRGLKYKTCECNRPFIGTECEFNSDRST